MESSPDSTYSSSWAVSPGSLAVSEEELRHELSLLGYPSVPRERLLQFKEDLESLMRSEKPEPPGHAPPRPQAASPDSYSRCTVSARAPAPLTRKVLRRGRDGQARVCDESLLSSAADDMSSGDSRPGSASSQSAVRSFIRLPPYSLLDQYRQRSDPVGRYQEYRHSWDALRGSLERTQKELRWEVRERMMSAPPAPARRALPAPNPYIVPTDKKRYGLRWAIRQDLVNGDVPGRDL